MLIPIRTGEPPVMSFIKTAKILATCVYELFEGGNIDTIANSPDKLVWRTDRATFSDLRKSAIHQAFGEFVVHTPTCSTTSSCCSTRRVAKPDLGKLSKPSNHPSEGYLRGNNWVVLWFDGRRCAA
jgi:hypothetical protein